MLFLWFLLNNQDVQRRLTWMLSKGMKGQDRGWRTPPGFHNQKLLYQYTDDSALLKSPDKNASSPHTLARKKCLVQNREKSLSHLSRKEVWPHYRAHCVRTPGFGSSGTSSKTQQDRLKPLLLGQTCQLLMESLTRLTSSWLDATIMKVRIISI